jgi:hypothetical protein
LGGQLETVVAHPCPVAHAVDTVLVQRIARADRFDERWGDMCGVV